MKIQEVRQLSSGKMVQFDFDGYGIKISLVNGTFEDLSSKEKQEALDISDTLFLDEISRIMEEMGH